MKKIIAIKIILLLAILLVAPRASFAESVNVKSYGYFSSTVLGMLAGTPALAEESLP